MWLAAEALGGSVDPTERRPDATVLEIRGRAFHFRWSARNNGRLVQKSGGIYMESVAYAHQHVERFLIFACSVRHDKNQP